MSDKRSWRARRPKKSNANRRDNASSMHKSSGEYDVVILIVMVIYKYCMMRRDAVDGNTDWIYIGRKSERRSNNHTVPPNLRYELSH